MKIDNNMWLIGGIVIVIGAFAVFKDLKYMPGIYDVLKPVCNTVELPFLCQSKAEAQQTLNEVDARKMSPEQEEEQAAMYAGYY